MIPKSCFLTGDDMLPHLQTFVFLEHEQILSLQWSVVLQSSTRYNKILLLSIYFCISAFLYIMHKGSIEIEFKEEKQMMYTNSATT